MKISAILAVIGSGGLFGIYKTCTNTADTVLGKVYMDVSSVGKDGRTIELSIFNAGADPMLVKDFRVDRIDPDLDGKLSFGPLIGSANVPNGRHPVAVGIEYLIATDAGFFESDGRDAFFRRHGGDTIRIAANVKYRDTTKDVACDVALNSIRSFIANRASPPKLSVMR